MTTRIRRKPHLTANVLTSIDTCGSQNKLTLL